MSKVKEFVRTKSFKAAAVLSAIVTVLMGSASAAEVDLTSAFTTGFTQIVGDMISMITSMVPIAISIAGTVLVVRKAMGWFKSIAK